MERIKMKKFLVIKYEQDGDKVHINNQFIRVFNKDNKLTFKLDIASLLNICLDIPTMIYNNNMNNKSIISDSIPLINYRLETDDFYLYRVGPSEYEICISDIEDPECFIYFIFPREYLFY